MFTSTFSSAEAKTVQRERIMQRESAIAKSFFIFVLPFLIFVTYILCGNRISHEKKLSSVILLFFYLQSFKAVISDDVGKPKCTGFRNPFECFIVDMNKTKAN